jgi:prevent-host-death family protein
MTGLLLTMRTITASEFKARCLELMDEVDASGMPITITKRGRPVAQLAPLPERRRSLFGLHKGQVRIIGDIVGPIIPLEDWEGES